MADTSPLTGTWLLEAWYNQTRDGRRIYPLGERATGYISYSPDGFVFVHLSAAERVPYKVNDPFGGTADEDSAAIKSQITYAGPYMYHGDHVIHRVTQSSCPNWVGTEQRRMIEFTQEGLRLSATGALFQGEEVTAIVDWRRTEG
ncbi:lipocalin-like domain-containing protein [Marivita sp. XM-24bin2]|mgnify:CR=1 FL=1|uniref:lipocalin-like domain-containing protein n=1 Tax=unclassified Marivita TaxID=2632480 RepID=UPI0025C09AFC|nr:lipocalin-like domain-containing protein [Marivita sp. XM-24bin2]MCR9109783.1 lipocalin-like domain-containing protein [Paracoccaceae bacterium]